jgi:hypothetical protein
MPEFALKTDPRLTTNHFSIKMPGTPDLRAQAKWQQKCAKNNPPPSNVKEDKNQLLIAARGRIRNQELKSRTELCTKNLSINTLTHLRRRREEQHDTRLKLRAMMLDFNWIQHAVNPVNPVYIRRVISYGRFDWFTDEFIRYVPYYERGRELSEKKFRQKLEEEVKDEIERICSKHIRDMYDSFDRTLDRMHRIKSDLMVMVNKFNCIRACRTIKEELVAVAWHPDRVWKWIKAGRYLGLVNGEPEHAYNVLNMMAGYESE